MTHPTTLAEALEMVPVYVMLPYGGKRYMERIPVPQEVRESMATRMVEMSADADSDYLADVVDDLNPFEWWLNRQGGEP